MITGCFGIIADNEVISRERRRVPHFALERGQSGDDAFGIGVWIGEALTRAGRLVDPLPERWRRQLELPVRITPGQVRVGEGMLEQPITCFGQCVPKGR